MKKIINIIKENYIWIIGLIFLILFIILIENVLSNDIMNEDIYVYNVLRKHLIRDNVTPIMKILTNCGDAYVIVATTILLVIFVKKREYKYLIPLNLILITILNQSLKFIVQRPRPTEYRIVKAGGYSFPSGHSMVSMAFYGYLIYLAYKNIKNKYLKWTIILLLSILIISIGISRIYLGVHYWSDVVAGFLLSLIYLIIFTRVTQKRN